MGHITHHALIVTGRKSDPILPAAQETAVKCGLKCTPLTPSPINGFATFLVVPDGSKAGWDASDRMDIARANFMSWLRAHFLEWVEVRYGHDDDYAAITNHPYTQLEE